jgi:hypothetical protein
MKHELDKQLELGFDDHLKEKNLKQTARRRKLCELLVDDPDEFFAGLSCVLRKMPDVMAMKKYIELDGSEGEIQ